MSDDNKPRPIKSIQGDHDATIVAESHLRAIVDYMCNHSTSPLGDAAILVSLNYVTSCIHQAMVTKFPHFNRDVLTPEECANLDVIVDIATKMQESNDARSETSKSLRDALFAWAKALNVSNKYTNPDEHRIAVEQAESELKRILH